MKYCDIRVSIEKIAETSVIKVDNFSLRRDKDRDRDKDDRKKPRVRIVISFIVL